MARLNLRHLARVSHNLATGIHAGLDIRKVWDHECQRSSGTTRHYFDRVRQQLAEGNTAAESFRSAQGFLPPLFCEMVEVGERTGRLELVFQRLADHYDQIIVLRRNFLTGIAWPLIEFSLGVLVIGIMIWVLGVVSSGENLDNPPSILGLRGSSGAAIWFSGVGLAVAAVVVPIWAVQQGWLDPGPLFRILVRVPGIGPGLRVISLARLTWALSMATDSDLAPDKSVDLAVRSTQNSYYTDMIEQMRLVIRRGGEMHEAFRSTRQYPDDFLDALQTGELSGRVSETLHRLSKDYDERAKMWYRGLTVACGLGVFLMVAAFMILMIFQVFQLYMAPINDALKGI